jgi:hypothetical protein
MKELTKLIGTEHFTTAAGASEENGVVEREIKEVNRYLRALMSDHGALSHWKVLLPLVQRIINSTPHSAIGDIRPASLLFGGMIDLDKGFIRPLGPGESPANLGDWSKEMRSNQTTLLERAKFYLEERDKRHLASKKAGHTVFDVGSWVFVKWGKGMGNKRGPPSKLMATLRGPMKVLSRQGDQYTLEDQGKPIVSHASLLSQARMDTRGADPILLNARDKEGSIVESILRHKGKFSEAKKLLSFRVSWKGTTEETWESWSTMRTTVAMCSYLHRMNLTKHIPNSVSCPEDAKNP